MADAIRHARIVRTHRLLALLSERECEWREREYSHDNRPKAQTVPESERLRRIGVERNVDGRRRLSLTRRKAILLRYARAFRKCLRIVVSARTPPVDVPRRESMESLIATAALAKRGWSDGAITCTTPITPPSNRIEPNRTI